MLDINASFFTRFDRSTFRAFYAVARELNFTGAAEQMGATQSGVSQHIQKLERELGVSLFIRRKRNVLITEAGLVLKGFIEDLMDQEQSVIEKMKHHLVSLSGITRYSMPASCLMSPHFSMMLSKKKDQFSELDLEVMICHSDLVQTNVLDMKVDFGFITTNVICAGLEGIKFCEEEYVLITPNGFKVNKQFLKTPFIWHPDFESLFEVWHQSQFPETKYVNTKTLNYVGRINSVQGALDMVRGGVGATVMPRHCIEKYLERSDYKIPSGFKSVSGDINIIFLKDRILPKRVTTLINTFLSFYGKELPE